MTTRAATTTTTSGAGAAEAAPDHQGEMRTTAVEFFAPPPAEIGKLLSAESTLKPGKRPMPMVVRMVLCAGVAAGIVGLFAWIASQTVRRSDREMLQITGYVVAAIVLAVLWFMTRFKRVCTYVGEKGAARYTLRGSREAQPSEELLLFDAADEVHTAQTRQYVNGVYTGTSYDYNWTDAGGRSLFRLKGSYRAKKTGAKKGDKFNFADAAEVAWSGYYLDRADAQLKAEGSIRFRIDKKRSVRVGPGFLEFDFGGGEGPARFAHEDIAGVSLAQGMFSFKHKDAKWYSRAGKYNFSYGAMANPKVFLAALDRLMGYRWG